LVDVSIRRQRAEPWERVTAVTVVLIFSYLLVGGLSFGVLDQHGINANSWIVFGISTGAGLATLVWAYQRIKRL